MVKNQWLAGKISGNFIGKFFIKGSGEDPSKNPWVFNDDGTFMTMKDKHHGTWTTQNDNILKLRWESINGFADFLVAQRIVSTNGTFVTLKCTNSGWDFMKSWSLMVRDDSNGQEGIYKYVDKYGDLVENPLYR